MFIIARTQWDRAKISSYGAIVGYSYLPKGKKTVLYTPEDELTMWMACVHSLMYKVRGFTHKAMGKGVLTGTVMQYFLTQILTLNMVEVKCCREGNWHWHEYTFMKCCQS